MPGPTKEILDIIASFRKVPNGQEEHAHDFNQLTVEQVNRYVEAEEPIRFVIAGFPIKSLSRMKTLGATPDKAEEISLTYLNSLAEEIKGVYGPGAEIVIYNDMFAFTKHFPATFSKKMIVQYAEGIHDMLEELQLSNITYTKLNMSTDELEELHAENEDEFDARMRSKDPENQGDIMLYRGLMRFCLPEIEAVYEGVVPQPSNSQKKREAKAMAKGIALMSVAHRKALVEAEPDAVKLSAHAKPVGSAQLGAHLNPQHTDDGTPWHNCLLVDVDSERFDKAIVARERNYLEVTYPKEVRSSHMESEASFRQRISGVEGSFFLNVADRDKERALDIAEEAGTKVGGMVFENDDYNPNAKKPW